MSSLASIAMLTSVHSAFDVRIFKKECVSLAASGYSVVLVAPHDRNETVDGVKIIGVRRPRGRLHRATTTAWTIYRIARRLKADVYHFHDPELIPIGLLLRLTGRKVIYDVHECYPAQILSRYNLGGLRHILASAVRCIELAVCPMFSGVITVDAHIAGRCSARTTIVSNYPTAVSPIHKSPKTDPRVLSLVYAGGRLVAQRGLFKMIEALEYLDRPARLVLIGNYSQEDRIRARRLKAYDSVEWRGLLPHKDTLAAMSSMDLGMLLLQPTPGYIDVSDGCLKLFEYMACGLAVVASDFPGLSRIVLGEHCGVVADPTDPQSIAAAINELARVPGTIDALGKNGTAAVARQYNWNHSAQQMLTLYRDLLATG